jgi:hypothetical protein
MASYVITGRNRSGESVVSVNINSISQEAEVVPELDVVNAVRTELAAAAAIGAVVVQKYEQVVTVI